MAKVFYGGKYVDVEDMKCETGCKHFYGGEVRHHRDCAFYLESFTKMYDDLKVKYQKLKKEKDNKYLREIINKLWTVVQTHVNLEEILNKQGSKELSEKEMKEIKTVEKELKEVGRDVEEMKK